MNSKLHTLESIGTPLFSSRSSQVFAWPDNRMLKLFHADVDPDMIDNEAINTAEAYEKGISKVKYHGRIEVEGRTGIIIERVAGKTLLSLVTSKPGSFFKIPKLMSALQVQMHNTHTDKIRSYKEMVIATLNSEPLNFLSDKEKSIVINRVNALPDGNSILHLDYHPDNIMSDGTDATIIDWMTAARGVPAADVAATLYLLNEGEMVPGMPKAVGAILEKVRKVMCKNYLKAYKKATNITDAEIAQWRLPYLLIRLGVWNIASEVQMLQGKIRAEI